MNDVWWSLGILHLSKRFFRSDSVIFPPSWPVWAIWHNIASTWNWKVKLGLCWFGIACCPFSGLVSLIVFNLALASWSSTCTICARISIRAWLSWKTPGSGFRSSYSPSAPSSPAVASACHPHLPWKKYSKRSQLYWTPEWQSWPALIMWNSQEHTVQCSMNTVHGWNGVWHSKIWKTMVGFIAVGISHWGNRAQKHLKP